MSTALASAIVTGGASGIGASVVEDWVARGGRAAIIDLNAEAVQEAVTRYGPDRVVGFVADVSSDAQVVEAVRAAGLAFDGCVDAVINSAGIARPISAAEGSDADWVRMVDIHLNGTMRVCRASFEFLSRSDRAAIVNVSSVAASNGLPGRTNYSAAKAGVEGLTRALSVEWAPRIRVNTVAPGYVRTAMIDTLIADSKLDARPVIRRTPLGRFAEPAELASVINFLASPEASYVTGTTIKVDGGMSVEGNWYASND